MHLESRLRPIHHDTDPVAGHRVPSSPVSLQIIGMPGRIDELEPPGDTEEHGPVRAGIQR